MEQSGTEQSVSLSVCMSHAAATLGGTEIQREKSQGGSTTIKKEHKSWRGVNRIKDTKRNTFAPGPLKVKEGQDLNG